MSKTIIEVDYNPQGQWKDINNVMHTSKDDRTTFKDVFEAITKLKIPKEHYHLIKIEVAYRQKSKDPYIYIDYHKPEKEE